ncbi:hypothetical protein A3Q56_04971 [Intoshia linei]|uniref:PHD-type domain-containing protein n=1 Tax=Intoshia linei TaxID=1819745 RepID=A0A177B1I3_9BILA|nr:hypothetical protein A3Q56_04971 [Intoshia linei]
MDNSLNISHEPDEKLNEIISEKIIVKNEAIISETTIVQNNLETQNEIETKFDISNVQKSKETTELSSFLTNDEKNSKIECESTSEICKYDSNVQVKEKIKTCNDNQTKNKSNPINSNTPSPSKELYINSTVKFPNSADSPLCTDQPINQCSQSSNTVLNSDLILNIDMSRKKKKSKKKPKKSEIVKELPGESIAEEYTDGSVIVIGNSDDKFLWSQDICLYCGSFGKEEEGNFISCAQCAQCFHSYCIEHKNFRITPNMIERGWRCPSCIVCETCFKWDSPERLILCDGCDLGYHIFCLSPPLSVVPEEEWYCKDCTICRFCEESVIKEVKEIVSEKSLYLNKFVTFYKENCDEYKDFVCINCMSLEYCMGCLSRYKEKDNMNMCSICYRYMHTACSPEFLKNTDSNFFMCSICEDDPENKNLYNSVNIKQKESNDEHFPNVQLTAFGYALLKEKAMSVHKVKKVHERTDYMKLLLSLEESSDKKRKRRAKRGVKATYDAIYESFFPLDEISDLGFYPSNRNVKEDILNNINIPESPKVPSKLNISIKENIYTINPDSIDIVQPANISSEKDMGNVYKMSDLNPSNLNKIMKSCDKELIKPHGVLPEPHDREIEYADSVVENEIERIKSNETELCSLLNEDNDLRMQIDYADSEISNAASSSHVTVTRLPSDALEKGSILDNYTVPTGSINKDSSLNNDEYKNSYEQSIVDQFIADQISQNMNICLTDTKPKMCPTQKSQMGTDNDPVKTKQMDYTRSQYPIMLPDKNSQYDEQFINNILLCSQNVSTSEKWKMDEKLNKLATISSVLYCNINYPNMINEIPDWEKRSKEILKIWRKLPVNIKPEYIMKAKNNRVIIRRHKKELKKNIEKESDFKPDNNQKPFDIQESPLSHEISMPSYILNDNDLSSKDYMLLGDDANFNSANMPFFSDESPLGFPNQMARSDELNFNPSLPNDISNVYNSDSPRNDEFSRFN